MFSFFITFIAACELLFNFNCLAESSTRMLILLTLSLQKVINSITKKKLSVTKFDTTKLCNVTRCEPNPCRNGGKCEVTPNSYHCSCKGGWKGIHCSEDIDECKSGLG